MQKWFAVVALLLLAGCGDAPEPDAEASTTTPGGQQSQGLQPSDWTVGDHWTFGNEFTDSFALVVTEEAGDHWIVGTTSDQLAFANAREDISFLGKIRKSDLAGSQGDEWVQYFDFPLHDAKTWTTNWDGMDVRAEATKINDGNYVVEAYAGESLFATYDYDASVGWFTTLVFYNNGSAFVTNQLQSSGSGFSGDLVSWELQSVLDVSGQQNHDEAAGFTVENATDIWAAIEIACSGAGGYTVSVQPVSEAAPEQGYAASDGCQSGGMQFSGVIQPEPAPGQWVAVLSWGDAEGPRYDVEVLLRDRIETPYP